MMRRISALVLAAIAVVPSIAAAQLAPPPPARPIELAVGGTFAAPVPVGSGSASLLTPSGGNLDVFDFSSSYGIGYGAETVLGFRVAPRLWLEAAGGISRTSARADISSDVESIPDVTVSEAITRFSAEGAVRFDVVEGSTVWFLRGGGGWMRELAGGNSVADDGFVVTAGGGMRHWFREGRTGAIKRLGLRLEGRVLALTRGIEVGSRTFRLTPGAAGSLIIGF